MRREESAVIRKILETKIDWLGSKPTVVINLGAGDLSKTRLNKPWIDMNVFAPLKDRGLKTVNVDLFDFPGIDKTVDFSQPQALQFLTEYHSPKLVILANVLEHISQSTRDNLVKELKRNLKKSDYLLISAPHAYPYHPDPIDSMYRPSFVDLQALLDLNWLFAARVECGSFWRDLSGMSWHKKIRKLIKPLIIFQRPKKYWSSVHQLLFLFRDYKISVVFGQKP